MNVWDVEGAAWQNGGVEPGRDLETLSEEVLRRQVRQIDAMIDRDGGSSGGWHPQEQDFFLSMWAKSAGLRATGDPKVPHSSRKTHGAAATDVETKAATNHKLLGCPDEDYVAYRRLMVALRQQAVTTLPSRSAEEVDDHARWYMEHLRRVLYKKRLLDEWRLRTRRVVGETPVHDAEVSLLSSAQRNAGGSNEISGAKSGAVTLDTERKRQAVVEWRRQKEAEMETKRKEATLAAAAAAEEDALRLKRRNRLMREKVALYKLEKEKCAGHEAEIRTLLRGDGRTNLKSVGISGGFRGDGGARVGSRFNSAELRARRDRELEGARMRRRTIDEKASAVARDGRTRSLVQLAKARGEVLRQKVTMDTNRALRSTAASEVGIPG